MKTRLLLSLFLTLVVSCPLKPRTWEWDVVDTAIPKFPVEETVAYFSKVDDSFAFSLSSSENNEPASYFATYDGVTQDEATTFGFTLSKQEGALGAYYGLVLYKSEDSSVPCLAILINSASKVKIGKIVGGQYIPIVQEFESENLIPGLGAENSVTLKRNIPEGSFDFCVNGTKECSFSFTVAPTNDTRSGFLVIGDGSAVSESVSFSLGGAI